MVKGFRDMTVDAALKEAQKRWGPRAQLRVLANGSRVVGYVHIGLSVFREKGRGPRWREAFEQADGKASPWDDEVAEREALLQSKIVEPPRG